MKTLLLISILSVATIAFLYNITPGNTMIVTTMWIIMVVSIGLLEQN